MHLKAIHAPQTTTLRFQIRQNYENNATAAKTKESQAQTTELCANECGAKKKPLAWNAWYLATTKINEKYLKKDIGQFKNPDYNYFRLNISKFFIYLFLLYILLNIILFLFNIYIYKYFLKFFLIFKFNILSIFSQYLINT